MPQLQLGKNINIFSNLKSAVMNRRSAHKKYIDNTIQSSMQVKIKYIIKETYTLHI